MIVKRLRKLKPKRMQKGARHAAPGTRDAREEFQRTADPNSGEKQIEQANRQKRRYRCPIPAPKRRETQPHATPPFKIIT